MKIPAFLLRKLNIFLIIFLDNIPIMAPSVEKRTLARIIFIYFLQGLDLSFLINVEKSILGPCQTLQFLCVKKNSKELVIILPQNKKDKITSQCQTLLGKALISIRELTRLISQLSSTATAVLPVHVQYRAMQLQ